MSSPTTTIEKHPAATVMSVIRMFAGGFTWASPALSSRLFGLGPVLGAALHHPDSSVRKAVLQAGIVCDSADVVASLIAVRAGAPKTTLLGATAGAGLFVALGLTAVVFATGIAILRYRLYEIDRVVSRTISYALLTAMLVGVFVGVVALTTRVLPFSSPVAVAASTLAAAALFNPLRQRLQHLVDRRFNRARYNAEAIVAAFTARLQEAVDLDTVREDLLSSVRCVQPVHASLWIRPRDPNARA